MWGDFAHSTSCRASKGCACQGQLLLFTVLHLDFYFIFKSKRSSVYVSVSYCLTVLISQNAIFERRNVFSFFPPPWRSGWTYFVPFLPPLHPWGVSLPSPPSHPRHAPFVRNSALALIGYIKVTVCLLSDCTNLLLFARHEHGQYTPRPGTLQTCPSRHGEEWRRERRRCRTTG